MKTTIHASVIVSALILSTFSAHAGPMGSHLGAIHYLAGTEDLRAISVGIEGRLGERDVTVGGITETQMDRSEALAYIGLDVLRFATVYAGIGANEIEFEGQAESDSEGTWAVGLHLNLLDRLLMAPSMIEDRLRLDVNVEWQKSESRYGMADFEWTELTASAMVGLVNDIERAKTIWPESIMLFAGPVYSAIDSDRDILEEADDLGFAVGLTIYVDEVVTLTGRYQDVGSSEFVGGVNVQF